MKLMIRTDMEGASGIVSYNQAEVGLLEYETGRKYFQSDLNALLKGVQGADISVYDEHFYGRNIDLAALPPGVKLYFGKPPYKEDWAGGLDSSFDGMILLGFHSKAGTEGALLPHSYELDISDIRVCGLSVGEIGIEAMIAGELGVPAVLFIGDDGGSMEAAELIPEIERIEVKKGHGSSGGLVYPLNETAALIESMGRRLVNGEIKIPAPYPTPKSPRLEIDLRVGNYRDNFARLFPEYINGGTVTLQVDTLCGAWALYWRMKLAAQAEG